MRHHVLPRALQLGLGLALVSVALVSLALGVAGATARPAAAEGTPTSAAAVTIGDKKVPTTLLEIGRRLDKLIEKIDALRKEAKRDPDEGKITIYENYTHEQFKSRKRKVRAEHLVEFMSDTTKEAEVRKHAFEVLKTGPMLGDPDLNKDKKAGTTKRGWFSIKYLIGLLRDEDKTNREYAKELLDKWFWVRGVKAIMDYDVEKPKTWKPGHDAWKREIKKQRGN